MICLCFRFACYVGHFGLLSLGGLFCFYFRFLFWIVLALEGLG